MKKLLLVGALLGVAGLLVWWSGREPASTRALEPELERATAERVELDREAPSTEARAPGEGRERAAPEPALATDSGSAEPVQESVQTIDRTERRELVVHVHDVHGNPIHSAKLSATGTRTVQEPGSWYGWRDAALEAETDIDGLARLTYPVFLHGSGGGWFDVGEVCFTVAHPDFIAADLEARVEPGEYRVVLEQGSLLIVSGWIGARSERVVDVRPRASDDVELAADAWTTTSDGRPTCSAIPPGTHKLVLEHERDGLTWHSVPEVFTMRAGDQLELHLELIAPRQLAGVLDPQVPRPIVDGEVLVHVYAGERGEESIVRRTWKAKVAPDGGFEFPGIRHGAAEIIGICEGWSSLMLGEDGDEAQEVPVELEGAFTLRMQPTAALEVEVKDPAGAPLAGAHISTWPNVHWRIGYATIFMDRRWDAVTDPSGRARIVNLPPGLEEGIVVRAAGYRMPLSTSKWGNERRQAWTDYTAGETARLSVQLEPGED